MGRQIGIAIIGTGSIAEAHIFAYQREGERARMVALVDVEKARAMDLASRYSVNPVYADYREVLEREDVEAVSICTPPFTHVEISRAALRAGKHVLCEKAVAPTLAGLDAIEERRKFPAPNQPPHKNPPTQSTSPTRTCPPQSTSPTRKRP